MLGTSRQERTFAISNDDFDRTPGLCCLFFFIFKKNVLSHILDMHFCLKLLPVSKCPIWRQTCYSGPEMCKLGRSKTYNCLLPRTGSFQAVFCTNAAANAFLDLCKLSLRKRWVLTNDERQVQTINKQGHGTGRNDRA